MRPSPPPSIVVLTGAGISAESGLRTFRDAGGLWENHRVEDVATPEAFLRNPALVHAFYNQRRAQLREVRPNAAHLALARLEREWSGDFLLVTQNVDDLHDRAGSRALIHMHGELLKVRCAFCSAVHPWEGGTGPETRCPACARSGGIRPHIVWFGEMPLEMDRIGDALERCDLFVAVGTSGNVYPAAGFVGQVPAGARTLELNLEPSSVSSRFSEQREGPASVLVPALVEELLG
ncbi:Sir2 family NAD+-dependent deacetylase [Mesoterricola silvestris]|uniref:NAD-dependent protein deacylase n=1 Tax=Mesoterricola silvestris TaxID=2927979 RepID=A0AA48H1U7_9BACT|nr:Sir2 family NAD+-dependent deacetylase [Mesoterricola silvestris]BDU74473.1 NAD-dependent protein deacylase [Mesoterricola silvestris]